MIGWLDRLTTGNPPIMSRALLSFELRANEMAEGEGIQPSHVLPWPLLSKQAH